MVATVALSVLAVADVVFLNIRERASELATLQAFGWRGPTVWRLVITEGTISGLAGSLAGAALGVAATAAFAGAAPAALWAVASAEVASAPGRKSPQRAGRNRVTSWRQTVRASRYRVR